MSKNHGGSNENLHVSRAVGVSLYRTKYPGGLPPNAEVIRMFGKILILDRTGSCVWGVYHTVTHNIFHQDCQERMVKWSTF